MKGIELGIIVCMSFNAAIGAPFSDVTVSQGVEFYHVAPTGDEVFTGAGAAWGDYDGDGWVDLYVTSRLGSNALFRNQGNGQGFENVAAQLGVDLPDTDSHGALWGDYDNDGDKDLYVFDRGPNIMFRNLLMETGSPGFEDVTDAINVGGDGRTLAAVYGDYDNDGWLDLYVCNHDFDMAKAPDQETLIDPLNADYFFHNIEGDDGERAFENVAVEIFGESELEHSMSHSAALFDYDNDGDLDLYVVNEVYVFSVANGTRLYRNDGSDGAEGWIFTNVTDDTNSELRSHPMGLAVGDYNNDGWFDFATSDLGPNNLLMNLGGTFDHVAEEAGVDRPFVLETGANQFGWGILFIDHNLDGFEDLYVGTGEGKLLNKIQPNPLFANNGDTPNNTFDDVSDESGANDESSTRCVAKADYDRDGDEDIYVVNYGDEATQKTSKLFENTLTGNTLALELVGLLTNRDAIGARVKVSADGLPDQYRMVQSGSTTNGSHELTLYFGMGEATKADAIEIEIDWPSGISQTLTDVAVNQRLVIYEDVPLTGTLRIVGDSEVGTNSFANYQAELVEPDDSVIDVTGLTTWDVTPASLAQVTAPGTLQTFSLEPGAEVGTVTLTAQYEGLLDETTITVLDSAVFDVLPPVVSIQLEQGGTSLETDLSTMSLQGTAEDEGPIVSLVWDSDQGFSGPCSGTIEWNTGPISLLMGPNTITVSARDASGNQASSHVVITRAEPEDDDPADEPIDNKTGDDDPSDPNGGGDGDNDVDPVPPSNPDTPLPHSGDPLSNDNVGSDPDSNIGDVPSEPVTSSEDNNHQVQPMACGLIGMTSLGMSLLGLTLTKRRHALLNTRVSIKGSG